MNALKLFAGGCGVLQPLKALGVEFFSLRCDVCVVPIVVE
jgi:hypothetical protein